MVIVSVAHSTGDVPSDAAMTNNRNKIEAELNAFGVRAKKPVVPGPTVQGAAAAKSVAISVDSAQQKLFVQVQACNRATSIANGVCLESTSPAFGEFLVNHGTLIQGIGAVGTTVAGQCSMIAKTVGAANAAIGAFQAACGAAQAYCASACKAVAAPAKVYSEAANAALTAAEQGVVERSSAVNHVSIAAGVEGKLKEAIALCAAYQVSAQKAVIGLGLSAKAIMDAKKCSEETSSTAALDCSNPKSINYSTRNCQCARNELPMGECQGIRAPSAATPPGPIRGAGPTGLDGGGPKGPVQLDSGGPQGNPIAGGGAPPSGGPAGAPGGGAGGGLGGAGTPGGASQDGQGPNGRRLNTNVLGGFSGGGGAGMGGAGPGYGELDAKLKEYGPGGAKDPNRKLASEFSRQVTAEAGRSNWEKVRARYKDNQRTLFNK